VPLPGRRTLASGGFERAGFEGAGVNQLAGADGEGGHEAVGQGARLALRVEGSLVVRFEAEHGDVGHAADG
jgi:hypothetical protein